MSMSTRHKSKLYRAGGEKNQALIVNIPKAIVDVLKVSAGDKVSFYVDNGIVIVERAT